MATVVKKKLVRKTTGESGSGGGSGGCWKVGCGVGLVILLAVGAWIGLVFVPAVKKAAAEQQAEADGTRPSTGFTEMSAAEQLIMGDNKGTAHGNNEVAKQLAADFAERMKLQRGAFFTGYDNQTMSLTGGNFVTFCQLRDEACVFLLHVPNLRKYDKAAQKTMVEIAWVTANDLLTTAVDPAPPALYVGVKGVLMYEDIVTGTPKKGGPAEIARHDVDKDEIQPFFKRLEAAPAPVEPAP